MKTAKKIIGLLSVVVAAIAFVQCGTSKKDTSYNMTSKTPFTISYGTFQEWVAGIQSGGSGTNVAINFKEIDEGVVFEKMYFQGQVQDAKTPESKRIAASFKKNGNAAIIMDSNPINEAANTPPEVFPFTLLRDEAVLSYTFNGKTFHTKISALIEEKPIAYPAAPPNGRN